MISVYGRSNSLIDYFLFLVMYSIDTTKTCSRSMISVYERSSLIDYFVFLLVITVLMQQRHE